VISELLLRYVSVITEPGRDGPTPHASARRVTGDTMDHGGCYGEAGQKTMHRPPQLAVLHPRAIGSSPFLSA
jgi:hypothetical protein